MATPNSNLPVEIRADERVLESHRMDSLNILIYLFLLSLTVVTVWIFKHRRFQYIHETGLAIIYGLIVGAIIRYASPASEMTHSHVSLSPTSDIIHPAPNFTASPLEGPPDSLWLDMEVQKTAAKYENRTYVYMLKGEVINAAETKETGKLLQQKATFDPEIFFNIILPPIIFSAGYSMKRRHFFQNFGAIFTYAILGTTVSSLVIAAITFAFTRLMPAIAFTFNDCLFFGAIISSTDPVTILAIFNDIHVDVNLHAIVFGESALNDAVAIVFANAVQSYAIYRSGDEFDISAFFKSFGSFFTVFFGSFSIGVSLGCATALLTKFTRLADFSLLETALFVLMSYSTFLIAEAAELSGIVAVLFCGISQAHYTYNNLSKESQHSTKFLFELLSFLAECFIFCYIGVSMFTFPYHYWSIPFILVTFFAVILGRVCNVYPLSALLNLGRKKKIPLNFQHMIFFSGLRGAISFALAIRNTVTPARQAMLTATSCIVIITVIMAGGAASPLLHFLRIPTGVSEEERRLSRSSSNTRPEITRRDRTWAARLWRSFDVSYVKPMLTHSRPTLMDTCPDCCGPVAKFFTSSRQFGQERWNEDNDEQNIVSDDYEEDHIGTDLGEVHSTQPSTKKEPGNGNPYHPGMTSAFDNRDIPV